MFCTFIKVTEVFDLLIDHIEFKYDLFICTLLYRKLSTAYIKLKRKVIQPLNAQNQFSEKVLLYLPQIQ